MGAERPEEAEGVEGTHEADIGLCGLRGLWGLGKLWRLKGLWGLREL